MKENKVSLSEKFLLTFDEAACYFGIGSNKLRKMADFQQNPKWIVKNGSHRLIKRVLFEEVLLKSETI